MKILNKLISLTLALALMLPISTVASAQAISEESAATSQSSYEETATLPDGNTVRFVHVTDKEGNRTVTAYEQDGSVYTATYYTDSDKLYLNGELIPSVDVPQTNRMAYAASRSNWRHTETVTQNYFMSSAPVAAIAAAMSAFTHGAASAILNIIVLYEGAKIFLSVTRNLYLNYVDYSPKVGGYYNSQIYSGRDGTGSPLGGTINSGIFVR
ncbi:MAG: hypothetical protein PHZ05_03270 [Pygmaiobacter massiliensis]|uniref:hypothetical protein n=1 Tax=Pygmaiobacter massiliensis TaxID=1917873 RepID=UPI002897FED4|nr:hypothetical protein [Pygmaiobacter massiliensis]MDD3202758.1 hypothetical protein [Pygmaiobacter massiliensis]